MNKQQREYALAKAYHETKWKQKQQYETDWLQQHGRTENFIFKLPHDNECEKLSEKYYADETALTLDNEYHSSIDRLKKAEDALIEYGLSIIPDGLANQIRNGLHLHKIRERMIDIVFRLDTKTVSKQKMKSQIATLYSNAT